MTSNSVDIVKVSQDVDELKKELKMYYGLDMITILSILIWQKMWAISQMKK